MGPQQEQFIVKDSGKRQEFESGMVRDTTEGKIEYWRALVGPMFKRLAIHVTKACVKYPDIAPGVPNWTLASGEAEYHRFKDSFLRHTMEYLAGKIDEDHAAAMIFNLNGMEYVKEKMELKADAKCR